MTPRNKIVLIDGGEGGKNILLPYLLDRGISKIDYIIISHFDSDHVMGLVPIIEKLKVENIIISKQSEILDEFKEVVEVINKKKIPVQIVQSGDRIILDKYTYMNILYPSNELKYPDLNNNSIVCKLIYNNFSCILTGDIEEPAEQYLVGDGVLDVPLQSTILKISHHGSKTSSTEEFLEAVNPKIALIGVR